MTSHYLSLAKQGKNAWWRYLVSIIVILFFCYIIGVIPWAILMIGVIADGNPTTSVNLETFQFKDVEPIFVYLANSFSVIFVCGGLYISICFIHQRRFTSLITPYLKIRWKRIWESFVLYFSLVFAISVLSFLSSPHDHKLTFNPLQFFIFLPIALVVTPLQASVEELLFRGYLMQGIALITRGAFLPIVFSSVLFMLPHLGNPEVESNFFLAMFFYFIFGVFLALITVKDNSLELAMGVHTANNLFVVLIMNSANSALPSPSIFTVTHSDLFYGIVGFIIMGAIFYSIIFRKQLSKPSVKS